jgi:molybdate transport system substrate-binding protein
VVADSQLLTNVGRMFDRILVALVGAGLVAASCGSADGGSDDSSAGGVTVFAAASLSAAFTELGDAFTAANPDVDVTFNFAGSSELVAQISDGAPVDVFASADLANMSKLTDAGLAAGEPATFATNVAEIIVEAGNPRGLTGVADLTGDDLVVVQCAPEVPCGAYAEQIFANAGITVTPSSYEENVKAVVTKVTLGEADAGIVYRTDVISAGAAAEGVPIPDDINVVAEYPIALVAEAPNAAGAQALVDFVLGSSGQEILAAYGFGPP